MMPIINNEVYCLNHHNTIMVRNEGLNALISFKKTEIGVAFDSTTGVPLVVYSCPLCGYVELYAAQKTSFWNETTISDDSNQTTSRFERNVVHALRVLSNHFPYAEIQQNVRLRVDDKFIEIDALLILEGIICVIEIKGATSPRILEKSASQIRHNAYLYKKVHQDRINKSVIALLVVPDDNRIVNEILGVPILKYNTDMKQFTNIDYLFHILRRDQTLPEP